MSRRETHDEEASGRTPFETFVRALKFLGVCLLVWVLPLASVYVLVAFLGWRWPRAVIFVFAASGVLLLTLPALAAVFYRLWSMPKDIS